MATACELRSNVMTRSCVAFLTNTADMSLRRSATLFALPLPALQTLLSLRLKPSVRSVSRVARLMSVGHGGQILVSDSTRVFVRGDLPADASLIDLGSHRLKDLAQPEHIWMLSAPGLRSEFPALTSLDSFPNNLPVQITTFRGREQDLEDLKPLLDEHRLVTIHGPGGMGKTRLALQAGADVLE